MIRQSHQRDPFIRFNVEHGPIEEKYLTQAKAIMLDGEPERTMTSRHWQRMVMERDLPICVSHWEIDSGKVVEETVRERTDKVERCLVRMNGWRRAADARDDLTVVLSVDGVLLSGWGNREGDSPKLDSRMSEETYRKKEEP